MNCNSRKLSIVAVGAAAMLAIATLPTLVAADPTPSAPSVTPASAASEISGADKTRALIEGIWWNQPDMMQALRLNQQQRQQMDRRLMQLIEDRRAARSRLIEQQRTFADALAQGNWDTARAAGAVLRQGVADAIDAQTGLKIDVVSWLDGEQRQIFVRDYPNLLQRPWVVGAR